MSHGRRKIYTEATEITAANVVEEVNDEDVKEQNYDICKSGIFMVVVVDNTANSVVYIETA